MILFPDANDARKVIVKKLALCVPGRDDMELDLTGDLTKLKKQVSTPHINCEVIFIESKHLNISTGIHHKGGNSI